MFKASTNGLPLFSVDLDRKILMSQNSRRNIIPYSTPEDEIENICDRLQNSIYCRISFAMFSLVLVASQIDSDNDN